MPTYGYRCEDCQKVIEVIQSIKAQSLVRCAECGGHLTRILYPPGIVFKGTGYYRTDYKPRGDSELAKS